MPRKIPQHVIDRLEIHERTPSGRARNYVDPVTGELVTQYERQSARTGLSPAAQAAVRKSGNARAMERAVNRKESPNYLAEKLRQKIAAEGGKPPSRTAILKDKNFWSDVDKLKREEGKKRIQALAQLGVISASYAATIIALYDDGDDVDDGSSDYDDYFDAA